MNLTVFALPCLYRNKRLLRSLGPQLQLPHRFVINMYPGPVSVSVVEKLLDDVAEDGVDEFVANFERDGTAVFKPASALENPGSKTAITPRNKRAS
jgi:hypothetical protein